MSLETWNRIRGELNNSYGFNENWEEAIIIFNERLKTKFFNPLRRIIRKDNNKDKFTGEGFTIMTVLCAIIECFAAFRIGRIHKHDKRTGEPNFYYRNESSAIFTNFIIDNKNEIFKNNFFQIDANNNYLPNVPFNAMEFYSDVRCGLMHEARTKSNWTINAYPNSRGAKHEEIFIKNEDGKRKIYRTVLFYKLEKYLKSYSDDLRDASVVGNELRRLFARKLDHLFGIPEDSANFDWWIDR